MEDSTMGTDLYRLVDGVREGLAETLFRRIKDSGAPHYRDAGLDELRSRCRKLVHEFLHAVHSTRKPFIAYIREITEERISTGYFLHEIQEALTVFEEELWKLCHRGAMDREELYQGLAAVSGIIGGAKDQLARLYLEHMEQAEQTIARLQGHMEELFKGTETVAIATD
jgi:hypothetical protein